MDLSEILASVAVVSTAGLGWAGWHRARKVAVIAQKAAEKADLVDRYEQLFAWYQKTITELDNQLKEHRERYRIDREEWERTIMTCEEKVDELEGQVVALKQALIGSLSMEKTPREKREGRP